jgi:hypothetical protein
LKSKLREILLPIRNNVKVVPYLKIWSRITILDNVKVVPEKVPDITTSGSEFLNLKESQDSEPRARAAKPPSPRAAAAAKFSLIDPASGSREQPGVGESAVFVGSP